MNLTSADIISIFTESVTEAWGVRDEVISSVCQIPAFEGTDEITVEADFDDLTFMQDYYRGKVLSIVLNILNGKATACLFLGQDCKSPVLADEFIDRYIESDRLSKIWTVPVKAERGRGLVLRTKFVFDSDEELRRELFRRLWVFTNERFTNELRPFIHYFEN